MQRVKGEQILRESNRKSIQREMGKKIKLYLLVKLIYGIMCTKKSMEFTFLLCEELNLIFLHCTLKKLRKKNLKNRRRVTTNVE